jgi:hypothetical protein
MKLLSVKAAVFLKQQFCETKSDMGFRANPRQYNKPTRTRLLFPTEFLNAANFAFCGFLGLFLICNLIGAHHHSAISKYCRSEIGSMTAHVCTVTDQNITLINPCPRNKNNVHTPLPNLNRKNQNQ